MKLRSPSYLWKLLLFSILIGTLPVIVLGTFSYYNSSLNVQEKVNESNKVLLQQTQMGVEQILRTVDNSATQFLQSPIVSKAFSKPITNQDFEMVHELYKGIATIQTYELGIKEIYLFSLSKKWVVTSVGVNEYSSPNFIPQLEIFSREQVGSFWTRGPNDMPNSSETVYFVKKVPFNAVNPKGIICVALSTDVIQRSMAIQNGKLGNAFIMNHNLNMIHRTDGGILPGSDMSGQSHLQPLMETQANAGQYVSKVEGKTVTVTYRKSSYNGWIYVSVASNEQLNEQNRIIGWITLLVCFLILIITLIIAWIGSKRMYSPIQSLYAVLATVASPKEKEKATSELQIIGERVDNLIRNHSQILSELRGQQTQLREFFMHKLLAGEISHTDFEEKLELYGVECTWPSMSLVAVQIDTLQNTRYEEKNRDLLMFAISNMVGELVPGEHRLVPVVTNDSQVTLIGASEQGSVLKQELFTLSLDIQKAIAQYLGIRVSIGISRPFNTFSHTRRAMHESMTALKFSVGLGQESILFIEDVQPQQNDLSIFPHDKEQALFDAIRAGNLAQSEMELKNFIAELFASNTPFQDYHLSLLRLLVNVLKFGQELSILSDRIAGDESSLIQSLFKLRNVSEMENWFWTLFVKPYTEKLENRRETQFKHISEAIIDIIQREFDSELTLENCSARINYHPHYVSRVFRQETGVNFGEYLTQYRMDIARKWLIDTNMKIAEIAGRLQYNNSANFIRSFRKTLGTTPGKYRDQHRGQS
ncbi:AraC family transcriptional regulator [Paenibacillus sp. 2003]|uniref:AraC family transcriptional regulator n=1 Tax=Paenibacillus TaxID=44249 RepID=UPI00285AACDF|nr:AraC family transcriptional regulator [Paenibacillus sp. 2003]MDR6717321.1 AraC-like DNA-binding protein [Paenibacillus sp. 2003]